MMTSPDPAFPKLAAALDAEKAALAFRRALTVSGFALDNLECRVERARLKSGRKALIGYRLTGVSADGRRIDQQAMLTLFPQADPAALHSIAPTAPLQPSGIGPATLDVDDLAGRAWLFPNDRKVHHIGTLLACHAGDFHVVHYVPEQGCTVRISRTDRPALYGKCRADDRGAIAARVWSAARNHTTSLRLAPVLSYDAATHILWQEEVSGAPLGWSDVLATPDIWSNRMASAVRAFHALPAPAGLKTLTVPSIHAALMRRAQRLALALPDMAARTSGVLKRLDAHRPDESNYVLSHCDLHPANLLWDGTSFALIDIDTAALAPPALDYGCLVAALIHKAVDADAPDAAIDSLIQAMRLAAQGELADAYSFNWFLAASLIGERLYRCGTRLKSPRADVRVRLLEQAERLAVHHG